MFPDPDSDLLPFSVPGVEKASDPGSGSATLVETYSPFKNLWVRFDPDLNDFSWSSKLNDLEGVKT